MYHTCGICIHVFQGDVYRPAPFLLFGVLSVAAGLLVLLLPETLQQPLADTLQQSQTFGQHQKGICCVRSVSLY